jgi:predicted RNA-binding protein (virulence factor B family)
MVMIGRRNTLAVVRETTHGLYLDGAELGEILLPRRYVPKQARPGDPLDVFIYLDSEDRLVATTETPLAMVGEFACLEVVGVNRDVGAFLNWGLSKDLLLPFREQERPLRKGDKVVVAIYLDQKSNRIVASTRLQRHLNAEPPDYSRGQSVLIVIAGETPLGYNAIVENSHFGLLYRDSVPASLSVGQKLKAYVRALRPGGKIDLSLDQAGYKRVAPLKEQIIQMLEKHGGQLPLDDSTSPEEIRQRFGVSKKAFKQALGALLKIRRIEFTNPGIRLRDISNWAPGTDNPAVLRPKAPHPPR